MCVSVRLGEVCALSVYLDLVNPRFVPSVGLLVMELVHAGPHGQL